VGVKVVIGNCNCVIEKSSLSQRGQPVLIVTEAETCRLESAGVWRSEVKTVEGTTVLEHSELFAVSTANLRSYSWLRS
jgi:hypothetical protein